MKFYSTNKKSPLVDLRKAVMAGLAPDRGLFMPLRIPKMPKAFFTGIQEMDFQEISFEVAKMFFGDSVPSFVLKEIIKGAFDFAVPLKPFSPHMHVLELFHGPTFAFKDFAARFMARLMSYFSRNSKRVLTVLVATSGDTGSAVANGFFKMDGVRVVILYPSKKVSEIQEKQLTTLGGNITALEVKGSFDDCQKLVKEAFMDVKLKDYLNLASANSINIVRLLPQSFYYFFCFSKLAKEKLPIVFSVPSGNFGNLTAGLIAKRMGLPVSKFIAATNVNDAVPRYLKTGIFRPRRSRKTLSNAMDVGNPSNFSRMLALYDNDVRKMRQDVCSFRFTDYRIKSAIEEVYEKHKYILDPHGAVAYLGLKQYMNQEKQSDFNGIFFETAHPAKFASIVENILTIKIRSPKTLNISSKKPKKSVLISNDFSDFKSFLINSL